MKPIFACLLAVLFPVFSFGQTVPTTCEAPDSVKMLYEIDAKVLAVESMQGTSLEDSVIIPQDLIDEKLELLLAVHNAFGLAARDTVVECLDIHNDPNLYSIRHVVVVVESGTDWGDSLIDGNSQSGNAEVDFLLETYGLSLLDHYEIQSSVWLTFVADQEYNTPALAKLFLPVEGVIETNNEYAFCIAACEEITQEFPAVDTFVILKYWGCLDQSCTSFRVWEFHLPIGCEEVEFAGSYGSEFWEFDCGPLETAGDFSVFTKFEVSPSPADVGFFTKITARSNMQGRLYLVNLPGQILKSQEIQLQGGIGNETFFETSHLPNGLYFLTLKLDNHFFTKKIIIHHR